MSDDRKQRHWIGWSTSGKTAFFERALREDILKGRSVIVVLLDPPRSIEDRRNEEDPDPTSHDSGVLGH